MKELNHPNIPPIQESSIFMKSSTYTIALLSGTILYISGVFNVFDKIGENDYMVPIEKCDSNNSGIKASFNSNELGYSEKIDPSKPQYVGKLGKYVCYDGATTNNFPYTVNYTFDGDKLVNPEKYKSEVSGLPTDNN
jgi:hypothetical protein